jgi:transcription-repair coupling factor (superfamily II helicase)
MTLSGLLGPLLRDPAVLAAADAARAGHRPRLDLTAVGGLRAPALAAIADTGRTVLAVTATGRETEDLAAALRSLLGEGAVAEFPSWETLPHERLSPRSDTVGRRLAVLRRLAHPDAGDGLRIVVAPIRSVLQPQVAGLGELEPVRVAAGQEIELEEVTRRLAEAAYLRTDLVEKRGDFAVRGGILDVFPPTEEHPLRLEFWGDSVEEIRYFKVADQRSLEVAQQGLWAPPCRELLLTETVRKRAHGYASEYPELADVFGKISRGHRGRGDGVAGAGPGRPDGAAAATCCRRAPTWSSATRSGCARGPRTWSAPRRSSSRPPGPRRRSAARARWTSAPPRCGRWPTCATDVRSLGLPWWSITPFVADAELAEFIEEPDADETERSAVEAPDYRGEGAKMLGDVRDALAAPQRVDPLQLRPATSSCTSSTASAATSRWCSARSTAATREYLVIEYAPNKRGQPGRPALRADRPARPPDPYVGGEAPSLSKMGGSDWAKAKGKARKAVRDIAVEL